MFNRRVFIAWLVFVLVAGTVGGTVTYGLYGRSDWYRRRVEDALARFFSMPTQVGGIEPHTLTAQVLTDLRMWLPGRRDQIFSCPRAVWDKAGADGGAGTLVVIADPVISIGSEAWEKEDYTKVLRSSLSQNFSQFNIRAVRLERGRLLWPRKLFRLEADGLDGNIHFDAAGHGDAQLTCRSLNGVTVTEPVQIFARLDPHQEDFIPEVTLNVPTLPLGVLRLDELVGGAVTQGTFAGRITLHQGAEGDWAELTGAIQAVKLEELTGRMRTRPIPAIVDLKIDRAVVRGREIERLVFNGQVRALQIDRLLSRAGLSAVGGEVRLTVHNGRVSSERIEYLAATGEWTGGSLDALARLALGRNGAQGQLHLQVNSLIIENNQITSGNIDVTALPPPGKPGTVDRDLLLELVERQAGVTLPALLSRALPATVEYSQMGAKLLIDHGRARVLSSSGAGQPLITIRVLGQDLPLLADMDRSFDLAPLLRQARGRVEELRESVRRRITLPEKSDE
ncbi:MAG: hypothetical protein AMXMBFR13_15000 [Phycisphaerae bacterium]